MIIDNFKPTNKPLYSTSAVVSSYLTPLENKIIPIETGTKIQYFIDNNNLGDVVIYKDDMLVSNEYIAKENDVFYVYVIPESGSGGDLLKMAIVIAVASYTGYYFSPAYFGGGATGAFLSGMTVAASSMATAYALNKWFPPDIPTTGDSFGSDSSTYGWGDTTNQKVEGAVLPILYGKHRVKPPYINAYVGTAQDGTQTLNQLFAIGLGEADSIGSVVINGNRIENYTGCTYIGDRLGTKDQAVIGVNEGEPDFTKTRTDFSQYSRVLTTDWYNFKTNQTVEKLGLTIQFNGLGEFDKKGNLVPYEVECEAQYSTDNANWTYIQSKDLSPDGVMSYCNGTIIPSAYTGVTTWTNWVTTNTTETKTYIGNIVITSKDANNYQIVLNDGITYYRYNCSISWYTSPMDNWGGDSVSSTNMLYMTPKQHSVNSYCYIASSTVENGKTYPNSSSKTIDMSGMVNYLSCLDATQEVRTFYFETPTITPAQLYVRVRRKTADSDSTKILDKAILASSSEFFSIASYNVSYLSQQRYPNIALFGISALATNQLNGSLPTISVLASRLGKDSSKPLNNPAWVCRDLIITHLKGTVNEQKFQQWANYCLENGYYCNIYIETQMTMKRVIDMIASLGQGYVYQKGLTYECRWEDYQSAPVQAFIFNDSNVAYDSYNEQYLSVEERFNTLEITYFDELLEYERNIITLQQDNIDVERKTNLVLYGCTNRDQAIKLGKIALRKARYETLVSSWTCDIDALHCGLYDIVYVQHSVPKWNSGVGSLIKSATTNTITLDQEVTLDIGTSYKVRIQHIDTDIVEEMYTVPTAEQITTDTLTFTSNFDNIPHDQSKYTFNDGKYFKIINISKLDDLRTKVTAVEYLPEIYNVEDTVIPMDYIPPRTISNLIISESLYYNKQGVLYPYLTATWNGNNVGYSINVLKNDVSVYSGISGNTYFSYYDVDVGATYKVIVNSIESESYTILGKLNTPKQITNASCYSTGGILVVKFDANDELDFDHYEIDIQGKTYSDISNTIYLKDLVYIDGTMSIYVVDTSGIRSIETTLEYSHREKSAIDLIVDSYLIEKGFQDGVINMFFSYETPTSEDIKDYDLWAYRNTVTEIGNYSASSLFAMDRNALFFEDGVVYKYYDKGYWYHCTEAQNAVIDRFMRYITTSSISDGLVRIFSKEPFAPYDVGDLWIDGEEVKVCTTSKYV